LTFGVWGKLLYNTLVMFDRQTDSLWSQLYGSAVDGPLTDQSLVVYPSLHTEGAARQARAYPYRVLADQPAINDSHGCYTIEG
jgi:hypothetical protein